jgi:RHS repeat-associated protein
MTDENGTAKVRYDYLPFGQEISATFSDRDTDVLCGLVSCYGQTSAVNQKFTAKERDAETGFDYFGARYYSWAAGRYTSPDWSEEPQSVPYANFSNPQTLNLYQYVGNNPISISDSDGHCWPISVCAHAAMSGVNQAQRSVENVAVASGSPTLAFAGTFTSGVARDVVNGVAGLGTVGEASGALVDSGNATQRTIAAFEDAGKAAGIALLLAPAGAAINARASQTTVVHFTNDAGVQSITNSGQLNAGTYVTKPNQIPPGSTSGQVEKLLEIGPGKGANSVTARTPKSNLTTPEGGTTTSGGAIQYRLRQPVRIDPRRIKKIDEE